MNSVARHENLLKQIARGLRFQCALAYFTF
jgi:hypothetical protein